MELRLALAALCLIGVVNSVPLIWDSGSCAQQCSTNSVNFNYLVGKTYVYNYDSYTKLNIRDDNGPEVRITAVVDVSVVSQCNFALRLRNVRVIGPVDEVQYRTILEQYPLSFSFDDGRVEHVCPSQNDRPWAINVKKAIVSNLQISMRNFHDSYSTQETDILGNCETNYQLVSNNWQGIVIRKEKNIPTCGKRQQAIVSFFPSSFFSQESTIRNIPVFADNYGCEYTLKNGIIRSSKCIESNTFSPMRLYASGPVVQTTSNIVFMQEVNGLNVQAPISTYRHNLLYSTAPEQQKEDASQTTTILRGMCSEITDEVKSSTPAKFEELVSSLRSLSYESASRIYQSVQRNELCQSKKLQDIFNNALIMAASEASIRLISEHYLQKEPSLAKTTYVSAMLAFANQPTAGSVKSAVQMLEKSNANRQLLLGVSSLIHNYCSDEKQNCRQNQDVQRALNILNQRLNKCQQQNNNEDEIIVALKAIRNIGHNGDAQNTIIECASQSSHSNPIRVAAIEALAPEACHQQVQQRLMELLKNDKSNEVRIIAYRVLSKCPKEETVRQIIEMLQNEQSQQVGSFIVSHMLNTKKSNNPKSTQYRDLLMKQTNIPESKFPRDIRKYSQNYELSHFFEQWGFGGYFRTDVIYENEQIPTSIRSKLSIPMYEKHVDLVEVGLRQKGLKSSVQNWISSQNIGKNLPEILRNAANKFKQVFSSDNSQRSRIRRAFGIMGRGGRDMEASLFLRIDGKDMLYISEKDIQQLSRQDIKQLMQNVERHLKNLAQNPNTDRAFAMTPVDAKLQLPTSNGLQLNVELKQTVVLGAKIQDGNIIPSAAMKSEASVNFGVKTPKSGYKWVANAFSAPKVQLKLDNSNGRVLLVSMPQDEIVLAQLKTAVKAVEHNGQERALQTNAAIRQMSGCTKTLTKPFGIEMCTKMDIPSKMLNVENVVSAPWNMKLTLKKNDREMKGWEFTFGIPNSNERQTYTYKIGFNTPRSRINREILAKFELSNQEGNKGIQMKLKSPMKSMEVNANYKLQANEMAVKALVACDNGNKLNVDVSVQQQQSGKKYEWKPKVLIQVNNKDKVNIKGSVSYENGQKSQLQIDLRSANNEMIKGTIVKQGSLNNNLKLSIDCQAQCADSSMRVFGTVDKSQKTVSNDIRVDYQLKNKQKQNVKLTSKFQNLGTSSLQKLNSFVEMTSTQFPEKNVHVSWNFLRKPNEHLENEVVLMYSNQFQDQNRKISVLQVSKMNNQKQKVSSSEHVLNVFIGPLKRDYELQGKTNIDTSDLPKIKLEVSGREKKQNKNFKSSFEFDFMSRVPLKVGIDAQVQAGQLNLRYSDKLEETGRNNYNGKFLMQYNKKQVNINYSFKIKSDQNGKVHQFDFDMKLPNSRQSTQHQGLLRMSPQEFELRSKLNHQGSPFWEYHSLVSKVGKSKLYVDTPHFTTRMEGNPHSIYGSSNFEFIGKSIPLKHLTDLQIQPSSVTFNTKTSYKNKQVSLNSQLSNKLSKLVLDAHPFNANFDLNAASSPITGNFEIRAKNSPSFHKTTVVAGPQKVEIKSKTQYNGNNLANIDCAYSPNAKSLLNVVTPHFTGNSEAILYGQQKNIKLEIRGNRHPYLHNSELSFTPKTIELVSKTQHNSVPIFSVNSLLSRNARSNLNLETKNIVANIIADPRPTSKSAIIKVEHRPSQLNHVTEVKCDPHTLVLTSKSDCRGQNLYTFDSQLSRNAKSLLNLRTQPFNANFEINPYTANTAKWSFESVPHLLAHSSDFSWTPKKQIMIASTTSRYGKPLASINSLLSRVDRSHLKVSTHPYDVSFEMQPFASSRSAKFIVKGNNNPVTHISEVTYQPNRQTTFTSKTETHAGNVHTVDARVSQYDKSHFKYASKAMNAILSVNPHSAIKQIDLEYTRHANTPIFHSTKLAYEPYKHTTLYSKTDLNNNQVLLLNSKVSHIEPSYLKIHSQPCEANFEVDPYSHTPKANLVIKGRQWPITHSTTVTCQPKQTVTIISNTEKSGRPYLSVNSLLSRVGQSHLTVNTVPIKSTLKVHPFANSKQFSFELQRQPNQLVHKTEVTVVPKMSFSLNSATHQYNKPLFVFNTHLNRQSESNLQFENHNYKSHLAINPFAAVRTGKFEFSSRNLGFDHHTDASVQSHEIAFNSNTQRNGQNLLNLNSVLSRNQKSHINIEHSLFNSQCELHPYAKSGQIKVISQRYPFEHSTKWEINQPSLWNLNTKTVYNNQKILHLNSNCNRQQSNLFIENPYFKSEATYQPSQRLAVDYMYKKSNRRVLMAVASNDLPKNSVSIELSLDADRNPQDKVQLTISADKQRYNSQYQLNIQGDFRGDKIDCPMTMADDLIRGPHDLSCQIRSKQNIYQVVVRHSIQDGKISCTLKVNENGKQTLNIQNNGLYEKTSDQLRLSGSLKVQSSSKSLDGFEMGAKYEHQLSYSENTVNAELNAKLPGDKPYMAQLKLNQKRNSIDINAVCETPLYDFQRQEVTLNCNIDSNKGQLVGALTTGSGKKIEVNGNFKIERNEASLSLRTMSDYESIPQVQIEGSLNNDQQKKALFSAEVNSEKYVSILGTLDFKDVTNFNGQAEFDSKWSPHLAINSRGAKDASNADYEVDVKKDAETLMITKFKGGRIRSGYQYKGSMDVSGSNVAALDVNYDPSNGPSYNAVYSGPYKPMTINYKATQSNDETKHTAKLCSPSCIQVQWIAQDKSTRSRKDQYLSLSLQNQQSSTEYKVDYKYNRDARSLLNRMSVNWNTAKYGYVVEVNEDRREANWVAQLITPQRKIELNGKSEDLGESTRTVVQFLPFALKDRSNKFEAEFTHRHVLTSRSRQLNSQLKISHNEWGQPILAKVDYQTQESAARPMELKVLLDCGKGTDKQILIDAQIENNDSNPRNKSLTVNVYNGNRRNIDAQMSIHLANLRDKMSAGLNWHWLNRQRQMKKGLHIIEIKPNQKSFTIASFAPSHQLNADGKWQTSDDRVNVEANVNVNGENRNAHAFLDLKNNVCGELQWMKEPADLLRKYHVCLNAESDRMLEISSESWNNNDKSVDASIVFDKRGTRTFKLHLHWNPAKWNNVLYTIMNAGKSMRFNNEYLNELQSEISHKMEWLQSTISRNYLTPMRNRFGAEMEKLRYEIDEQMRPVRRAIRLAIDNMPDLSQALEPITKAIDSMRSTVSYYSNKVTEKIVKQVTRTLTAMCAGNNDCYSLVYAYERRGLQGLGQEASRLSQQYQRDAHQIVYKLKGNVQRLINSLPSNYMQQINQAINSATSKLSQWKLSQKISSLISNTLETVNDLWSKVTESFWESAESLLTVLKQNEDLRAILTAIEDVARDVQNELRNVNWSNISSLFGEMMQFLLSPKHWLFDSRFTNYNLDAGEVTLVIKAPANWNTLRSKWVKQM